MQSSVVKIGLFGSASGDNCDITVAPLRLETITVCSGDVIDALSFTYRDRDKEVQTAGPWGGNGGGEHKVSNMNIATSDFFFGNFDYIFTGGHNLSDTQGWIYSHLQIQLGPSEFVTEVHGMYGPYTYGPHGRVEAITKLTFVTNKGSYGPFGVGGLDTENRFSVPVQNNGSIVGFFAHTGKYYVNGVGVYVKPF